MNILPVLTSAAEALISIGQGRRARRAEEKLQREAWSREDNAVQRRVADLKKAGLSPLLAAGDAAASSQPIIASKGVEMEAQGYEGIVPTIDTLANLMRAKADVSKTHAEEALARETAREKKIRNDAVTKMQQVKNWDTKSNQWVLTESAATVAESIAQSEGANLLARGDTEFWASEAQRLGVKQINYDLMKEKILMSSPGLNETELRLKALAASVIAQQQANEITGMNLDLYRRSGIAPQLFGAAMGLAGQVVPHGLYKLP